MGLAGQAGRIRVRDGLLTAYNVAMPKIVLNQQANLIQIIHEIATVDFPLREAAQMLGIELTNLQRALQGSGLGAAEAREVEWAMNRPNGWLDCAPSHHLD